MRLKLLYGKIPLGSLKRLIRKGLYLLRADEETDQKGGVSKEEQMVDIMISSEGTHPKGCATRKICLSFSSDLDGGVPGN